jgi:hypothetical protein
MDEPTDQKVGGSSPSERAIDLVRADVEQPAFSGRRRLTATVI